MRPEKKIAKSKYLSFSVEHFTSDKTPGHVRSWTNNLQQSVIVVRGSMLTCLLTYFIKHVYQRLQSFLDRKKNTTKSNHSSALRGR